MTNGYTATDSIAVPLRDQATPPAISAIATSAVTADLLTRVNNVALNVHTNNAPAVAAYQRLGFTAHCLLTERLARRRAGGWGIMRPIREALRLTWPRETR